MKSSSANAPAASTADETAPVPEVPEDARSAYPAWAQQLARKYLTKTLAQFILHGNVHDRVPTSEAGDAPDYVSLRDFLTGDLFAARDLVVFYDRSAGIHFADEATRKDFRRAVEGHDAFHGTNHARDLPKAPDRAFALLEHYFRLRLTSGKRLACIIDYAETVAPAAEAAMYGAEDRRTNVFLRKWARDPLFLESDFTLCLVTESLSDLSPALVQSTHSAEIHVPLPDESERRAYLDWQVQGREDRFDRYAEVSRDALAAQTAGLTYTALGTLLGDVLENRSALTFARLSAQKKELIEAEAGGLLAFVESDLDLDAVAGHDAAKSHLRQAARALRQGRRDVLPMGYLVSGPVGTGKTFLVTCFAGEIGVPMVELKNFRSQWQGVTEANLERVFDLLEAMAPVAVMIDEADAALGNREATGDAGVSQRVFARIAAFMSRPAHRGRVLFFLLTARPDLMPVDLKRQGRAEEHLALFYPQTRDGREELLKVMMRRTGTVLPLEEVPGTLLDGEASLSGADLEALLTRAKFRAAAEGEASDGAGHSVTPAHLQAATDDFIPPTYPAEIELQELAAALECTRRSMLPERYRTLDRREAARRLQQLKHAA